MASDLTGARLVEAGALALNGRCDCSVCTDQIRAALRAQAEAAGVTGDDLGKAAVMFLHSGWGHDKRVGHLLRAFAEVLRDA